MVSEYDNKSENITDPFKPLQTEVVKDTDLSFDSPHHTLGKGSTQAAPGNHGHKYSEITGVPTDVGPHDHAGVYSAVGHSHGDYAASNHNHNGVYADSGHNHNTAYAAIGHAQHETTSIGDWNAALYNGSYMGNNAANAPDTGWWYGWVIRHNNAWVQQFAYPFANGFNENYGHSRTLRNGTWGSWYRINNFVLSSGSLDNFIFFRHGGSWNDAGVSRWAIGNKNTSTPSNSDQFRIQRYDTAGNYAGNLMTGTPAGVVNFPGGHTFLMRAMESRAAVQADQAATIGIVAQMIENAVNQLRDEFNLNAGVTRAVGETLRAAVETGLNIVAPSEESE